MNVGESKDIARCLTTGNTQGPPKTWKNAKGNLRRPSSRKSTVPKVLLGLKAPSQSPNYAQGPFKNNAWVLEGGISDSFGVLLDPEQRSQVILVTDTENVVWVISSRDIWEFDATYHFLSVDQMIISSVGKLCSRSLEC